MASGWVFVTDFGDSAVTVPIAVAISAILLASRQWRIALAWLATFAGTVAVVGGLKIVLALCNHVLNLPDLRSPSGHVAISTVVYGGIAVLTAQSRSRRWRVAALVGATCLIAAIAVSRLALRVHTPAEVVVGLVVGAAALAGFAAVVRMVPLARLAQPWVGAAALVGLVLFHGVRWPTERAVHGSALLLSWLMPWCR